MVKISELKCPVYLFLLKHLRSLCLKRETDGLNWVLEASAACVIEKNDEAGQRKPVVFPTQPTLSNNLDGLIIVNTYITLSVGVRHIAVFQILLN